MKKIFAILLAATFLAATFAIPALAADDINYEVDVKYVEVAPKIDGVVNAGEYGSALPVHSYSANPEQFSQQDDHDDYDNWDVEFYTCWDEDNLYMAWVVKSEIHHALVKGTYDGNGNLISEEWPEDGSMLGHMWWNSCVQFVVTPGAPGGDVDYTSNYLEVGLCLLDDGDIGRVAWNYPVGVDKDDISLNDWDAAIVRDDNANTTTYEVAIPKEMSGIGTYGTDAQFGLNYAAAAQENYLSGMRGMLEWQDGIVGNNGVKNPNLAGVMTLAGGDVEQDVIIDVKPGEVPEEATDAIQIAIDKVNATIAGEDSVFVTNPKEATWNGLYAYNMLLKPVEGEEATFELVEGFYGEGGDVVFNNEIEDGYAVLAVHSDGTGTGFDRWQTAGTITVGSKLKIFGVNIEEGKVVYTNSMAYVTELAEAGGETSEDVSEEVSTEVSEETSKEESKVETSKEESKAETSKEESKATSTTFGDDEPKEDGIDAWIWIVIGVAVVAVAAVVVVIVSKKKKA